MGFFPAFATGITLRCFLAYLFAMSSNNDMVLPLFPEHVGHGLWSVPLHDCVSFTGVMPTCLATPRALHLITIIIKHHLGAMTTCTSVRFSHDKPSASEISHLYE
jgi:hypothetical protein